MHKRLQIITPECAGPKGDATSVPSSLPPCHRPFAASGGHFGWRRSDAQSLVEVALFIPIFTILVCYSVDFGYFFLAAATITSATRNAAQYAVNGPQSASQAAVPAAGPDTTLGTVANLAESAIGLPRAMTATTVEVCSNGVTGSPMSGNIAKCQTWGANSSLSYPADTDPESPTFQLNRVDVTYTVLPPIPMPSSVMPTLSFHRTVEMRAMQ